MLSTQADRKQLRFIFCSYKSNKKQTRHHKPAVQNWLIVRQTSAWWRTQGGNRHWPDWRQCWCHTTLTWLKTMLVSYNTDMKKQCWSYTTNTDMIEETMLDSYNRHWHDWRNNALSYLCPSLPVKHRPSTTPRHRTLFWAALVIPDQLVPCCFSSAPVSRLQLLRGRPLSLPLQVPGQGLACGAGFLRVCPIQPHFLRSICLATGSCPARSHRSSFRIFSCHWIL